ncbi:MAG: prepilin peptidase [Candidatus Eisenbacteria sp.]|nr:prepilin peptidase [Candidatus Eisenbacteria bacterium]
MDWDAVFAWLRHSPAGGVAALIVGLALGSFINVVIYRLPRKLSVIRPRSCCPACGRRIRPHENIPVLSYLLLRARCRGCQGRIPLRYPIVELLGGLLTLLAVRLAPSPETSLVWMLFALALLAVVFIDLDFRIIPDWITLPGTLIGLLWALMGAFPLRDALLGVVAGGGGLLLIALVYQWVTGREGLGMGDVKLMAMVGAYLGWQGALGTLLLGSLVGSLVGGGLVLRGKGTRLTALPFGTFLAPAAWVVLFGGQLLWTAYLSLFLG